MWGKSWGVAACFLRVFQQSYRAETLWIHESSYALCFWRFFLLI